MSAQALFREALDWLCLNLPAEALPASFRREGNSQGMSLVKNTPEFTPEQASFHPVAVCALSRNSQASWVFGSSLIRVSLSSHSSGISNVSGAELCRVSRIMALLPSAAEKLQSNVASKKLQHC